MLDLLLALRRAAPSAVQRAAAWSASRTTGEPQTGQTFGSDDGFERPGRRSARRARPRE
jgi:hypothetical protein